MHFDVIYSKYIEYIPNTNDYLNEKEIELLESYYTYHKLADTISTK